MTKPLIIWESAGHDDAPGDQNGSTKLVSHGYWSLGEAGSDRWHLELIVQNADLDQIATVVLGRFNTEADAKQTAEEYENDPTNQRFDADSIASVTVEVDVFPGAHESLTLREVAERGMDLIRGLEAPVVDVTFETNDEAYVVRVDTSEDPELPTEVLSRAPDTSTLAPQSPGHSRLLPTEVLTVRAADVTATHAVELPRLVYLWQPKNTRGGWAGRLTAHEPRLAQPTWHFVYDAFDIRDAGTSYAADVDAEEMLANLHERYVLWRIGVEHPADDGHEDLWVAVHEHDLVRVQEISKE